MPKIRDPNRPQHDADGAHYGAITIEMFPNGTAVGQVPYWDGTQWHLVRLLGEGGIDLSFDSVNKTVTIIHVDNRKYGQFVSDAVIFRTYLVTVWADAILKKALSGSLTADAVLA